VTDVADHIGINFQGGNYPAEDIVPLLGLQDLPPGKAAKRGTALPAEGPGEVLPPKVVDKDGVATRTDLRLRFETAKDAALYLRSLASLLSGSRTSVTATFSNGRRRGDLTALEIADRLKAGIIEKLAFVIPFGDTLLNIDGWLETSESDAVVIRAPFLEAPPTSRLWLQCEADVVTAIPALALPTTAEGLGVDAAHALVALGARSGGFVEAELFGDHPLTWSAAKLNDAVKPLCSFFGDSIWTAELVKELTSDGPPVAWVSGARSLPGNAAAVDPIWWERLDSLASDPKNNLADLKTHLATVFWIPFQWSILDIDDAPQGVFVVPPETSTISRLVPEPDRVVVAVDLKQPKATIVDVLLHLCSHCVLGHVGPGDSWGHWDTTESLGAAPYRHWDREVQRYLQENFQRATRRVTSLAECNPQEKAWLVLHDHIGRMVGQARTLHPSTERYQAAAYQRHAAQRLVAQLEEYGGAMLCDGVGLGKTYVATTVMVHYANAWREFLASAGRSSADDPFRVTVLSPNSVASTWQREALPPLAAHGVQLATIRVVSHSKLSRIVSNSEILTPSISGVSDMEHLLLSDLVIVDEAHNFRSVGAQRTTVLRDLLRLQPRRDARRKVLLLTATPVNNGLEDLRQQIALMFGKPLWFNDKLLPEKYRDQTFKDIKKRMVEAGKGRASDVAAVLVHGSSETRFAYTPDFRDDLHLGVQIPRVGDYLKEQEKRLVAQQSSVRAAIQGGFAPDAAPTRIAGELLDRIVVQRSRALCKQIELEEGSNAKLLFRADASAPEKLVYEDVYDETRDVLARFLPLFDTEAESRTSDASSLSLKVYMWADVRDGIRAVGEVSSVVGLQRVLVLKRLESSPVSFLITLLRLLALHTHRLKQLLELCQDLSDGERERQLTAELIQMFEIIPEVDREHIDLLLTGGRSKIGGLELLSRWSKAHQSAKAAADSDDPPPLQLDLFGLDETKSVEKQEQLHRLWNLRDDLLRDLGTLLRAAPGLTDVVFGRFATTDWPQQFINGGQEVDWPKTAAWAMRIVTDGKLRRLVARLLRARTDGQKVIVFSQFTDTLAYLHSVLRASNAFTRQEWSIVTGLLTADIGRTVTSEDVLSFVSRSSVVSGQTDDRETVIHAFAPFYRLGPFRSQIAGASITEQRQLDELWRTGWTQALCQPIDVLFATDVLAEGVNLQDAALLVNYDVHWNPVRMIQRAGRIDRRLNPAIEEATSFPDLETLADELGVEVPRYWWHQHTASAPVTVNLLLPNDLEAELKLRERIANKTLAIDFTLGLEQGTGAEADWMADYRYQGISALNAWQGDRAIEQIAGYQQRLRRLMKERGIEPIWVEAWNGWLREIGEEQDERVLAWANLGRKGSSSADYTRQLSPRLVDGCPHWLWTTAKPVDSMLNFWLALDGKTFPANSRTDLGFSMDASRPISADDLLATSRRLIDDETAVEELGREIGPPIQQGASAISAGFFGVEADRRTIQINGFRLLQLRHGGAAVIPNRTIETT
jgi:hypothetical protein